MMHLLAVVVYFAVADADAVAVTDVGAVVVVAIAAVFVSSLQHPRAAACSRRRLCTVGSHRR